MRTLLPAVLAAALAASVAQAGEYARGDLRLVDPYARATAAMAKTGAVFLEIRNEGGADTLLTAQTEVAARADFHESLMQDGIMRMRRLDDGLPLPAGASVSLAPGGLHLMLMGLKAPLRQGRRFPLTLRFARAGEITVEVEVRPMSAGARGHGGHSPGEYRQEGDHGHGQKMR